MRQFILMAQLMTRIPIPMQIEIKNGDLGKGNIYFPIIGGIIGVFLAAVAWGVTSLYGNGPLSAILLVVAYLWISGGLHMDGLSDTFDGLLSNRSRERMLEIMKDSRVGVFGVLVLVMTILLQIGTYQYLFDKWQWLILTPLLARYACVFGNTISTYARPDGMGKYFVEDCSWREMFLASLYVWPLAFALAGTCGLTAAVLVLSFTYFFTRWVQAKLGGITGDVIGAVIELNQLLVLLFAVAVIK